MDNCTIIQQLAVLNAQTLEVQATFIKQESQSLSKFIRQYKADRNPANSALITKLTETVFSLLSLKNSPYLNQPIIVLLNNMFNLDSGLITRILDNHCMLRNLREYCINFFKKYQLQCCCGIAEGQLTKLYFNLYSAVYLLAIFASYKSSSDIQTAGVKTLLDKSLIKQFLQLEFEEGGKHELFFLFSVLLVKVTRPTLNRSFLTLLKNFMLPHLAHLNSNEKTLFNYTYCLRMLLMGNILTSQEIKKHRVLQFFISNINSNGCLLMNSLDSIRMVLMNHQSLGSNCVRMGLVDLLKQKYDNSPSLVAKVLQKLVLFIKTEDISSLCSVFFQKIRDSGNRDESLRCFSMLLQYQSAEDLFMRLQNGLLDDIECLSQQQKQAPMVGLALNTLEVIASLGKKKLPQLYSCIVAKIQSSLVIQAAFDIGSQTKMLAQRLIQKHLIL